MSTMALAFRLSSLILLASATGASAATAPGPSKLQVAARIAGPDGGWDYVSFDPARRRVYVAHGSSVMVINADSGKVNPDFAAGDRLHAVVPVPRTDRIVTTNSGDSSARVLAAADGRLIASIPTPSDPDGATFDPSTGLVMVIDGDAGQVTMVDAKAGKSVGSIAVPGRLEFPAADGKGRLYINVEDRNEIAAVDIPARKVVARHGLAGCQRPTGLAYVSGNRLVAACGSGVAKILDAASGRELASIQIGAGPDAVIYDPTRSLVYIPSGLTGTLAVIALSGKSNNTLIDTVATQVGARTGTVDPKTGKIYLPTAQRLSAPVAGQRPAPKPGTFQVLVLARPPA
jgi:DNA-binding beta-propeller fold protein YncE